MESLHCRYAASNHLGNPLNIDSMSMDTNCRNNSRQDVNFFCC
jgi:hypothetical protein